MRLFLFILLMVSIVGCGTFPNAPVMVFKPSKIYANVETKKIELNDQKETNESLLGTNKLNDSAIITPMVEETMKIETSDSINEMNNTDDIKIENDKVNESIENPIEEIQIPINNKFSKTSEVIEIVPGDDDDEFNIDEYNEYENQYSDYGDDDDYQE